MKTYLRYFLGLVLALGLFVAAPAQAYVGITVGFAPPPLPVCVQPACPGLGYIWTPGYWAWDPDAGQYYWVPGAWVLAPEVGWLWTPCWWGWADGVYCFHSGYWGPQCGFYGGIAYGNGYYGHGYDGGYWHGSHFYYNRAANNVSGIAASRTFSRDVAANTSRVSFNGGNGGTTAVATADERRAAGEHHLGATTAQNAEARSALADPAQRFSVNHGNPRVTGTTRAGSFHGTSASAATSATRQESAFTGESRSVSEHPAPIASHPAPIAAVEHHAAVTHSAGIERIASVERSQMSVSHSYHAASVRAPSFHPNSVHFGGGGNFAHASVSHFGGGGGGGQRGGGGGGGNKHHN